MGDGVTRGLDMGPRPPQIGSWRALLVLGRVSNLPTVWSDCLAAWLIGGGGAQGRLGALYAGATLLYTGGMFLNDAFDAAFDRQYRPERPIPSGQISVRAVWIWAMVTLGLGWMTFLALGRAAGVWGGGLFVAIVVYDAVHKRTMWAPLLMSLCRFLLYLAAAGAAKGGLSAAVAWRALALAVYVAGLSCLARGESRIVAFRRWNLMLLLAPIALVPFTGAADPVWAWGAAGVFAVWILWCLRHGFLGRKDGFVRAVAGLLAGIALVDWLAASTAGQGGSPAFIGLFFLALVLQRVAPAT
jgi:4-hydroxybenzoate polyprenyltransferase